MEKPNGLFINNDLAAKTKMKGSIAEIEAS